jgi:hypothetical protein
METIAKRIGVEELERHAHICPEAYQHLDSRKSHRTAFVENRRYRASLLALSLVALAVNLPL